MTTVAVDRKSLTMAADKRMQLHSTKVNKVFPVIRHEERWLLGGAGTLQHILNFVDWFEGPNTLEFPDMGETGMLALREDGALFFYYQSGTPIHITAPFFAYGSGSDYAMGAMAAGRTPQQAVQIASKFDSGTGGGVTMKTLRK